MTSTTGFTHIISVSRILYLKIVNIINISFIEMYKKIILHSNRYEISIHVIAYYTNTKNFLRE